MSGTTAQEPAIRDLIQRYKICWEVWPEWIPTKGHPEKTGFEPALRSASIRKNRRDVRSEMKIIHRNGLGPIDECEERCLQIMQAAWMPSGFTGDDRRPIPIIQAAST